MNSVAINPEGDFFSYARTDPALLHSILYLVALHHDLQLGVSDSYESLYHGGEAFRVINQRLQDGVFSDMTIAAVAMLVTKEVRSSIHMDLAMADNSPIESQRQLRSVKNPHARPRIYGQKTRRNPQDQRRLQPHCNLVRLLLCKCLELPTPLSTSPLLMAAKFNRYPRFQLQPPRTRRSLWSRIPNHINLLPPPQPLV